MEIIPLNKTQHEAKYLLLVVFNILLLHSYTILFPVKKSIIHVSYSLDAKYFIPTLVSITSVMENQKKRTFIYFHLLCQNDVTNKIRKLITKLEEDYRNCKFLFYNLNNTYDYATTVLNKPKATYYRLKLQELLNDVSKVIYLDGDTLIFKDLSELYNLNITNKYYLGMLDGCPGEADGFNVTIKYYLNAGVILCNLEELRKDNMTEKFETFIRKNHKILNFADQTALNVIASKKNGIFPTKFCTYHYFLNSEIIKYFIKVIRVKLKLKDLEQARKNPYIMHYIFEIKKPWEKKNKPGLNEVNELWYNVAKKSRYFNLIDIFINCSFC